MYASSLALQETNASTLPLVPCLPFQEPSLAKSKAVISQFAKKIPAGRPGRDGAEKMTDGQART
jgi:hypothetical protein